MDAIRLTRRCACCVCGMGSTSQVYNWLFLNAENVTLPTTAAAQGDFATISLRTAEGKPRVALREAWTTGWG